MIAMFNYRGIEHWTVVSLNLEWEINVPIYHSKITALSLS